MQPSAPVHIPVEMIPRSAPADASPRMFRMLVEVAVDHLVLQSGLPDEPEWLRGPLDIAFHLPGSPTAIRCGARVEEVVVDEGEEGEHASLRRLTLIALPPEAATGIQRYVEERLQTA